MQTNPGSMRLQKIISQQGLMSRRKAEEAIESGRVTVNGRAANLGQKADPARDVIAVDGRRVQTGPKTEKIYLALNKPRGYVTTMHDEHGRRCVAQLVGDAPARVYPVGRLDRNSEGLILLTNDGDFANAVMHPHFNVPKVYRVTLRPGITDEQFSRLASGVEIDGEVLVPRSVTVLSKEPGRAVAQIVITQGKNRQVRRMCEAVGLEVARLKRTAIGPVRLGMLPPGRWRELTSQEVLSLSRALNAPKKPKE